MTRPDYVNGGSEPSIQTWEEACVISQEWADNARRAAAKRKQWRHWIALMLMLALVITLLALVMILTDTINP